LIALCSASLQSVFAQSSDDAQAKNFEGVSAAVGLRVTGSKTTFNGGPNDGLQVDKNSAGGVLDFSYSKSVSERWLIGGGFRYDLGSSDGGQSIFTTSTVIYKTTTKISNHYSVYFKPTFAPTEKVAIFAKVGFNGGTNKFTDQNGQMYSWSSLDVKINKNVKGIGYGFGALLMMNKNIFISGEYSRVNFSRVTLGNPNPSVTASSKTNLNQGILSVGYKF